MMAGSPVSINRYVRSAIHLVQRTSTVTAMYNSRSKGSSLFLGEAGARKYCDLFSRGKFSCSFILLLLLLEKIPRGSKQEHAPAMNRRAISSAPSMGLSARKSPGMDTRAQSPIVGAPWCSLAIYRRGERRLRRNLVHMGTFPTKYNDTITRRRSSAPFPLPSSTPWLAGARSGRGAWHRRRIFR